MTPQTPFTFRAVGIATLLASIVGIATLYLFESQLLALGIFGISWIALMIITYKLYHAELYSED